jgi:methionine-R-sulfoxide reductase
MRIHPPSTHRSRLTFLCALGGAALVGMGLIFYAVAKEKEKTTTKFDYTKPIPSDAELRSRLTPEQYRLTRENGTEGAFHNLYWDNFRPGIYVDIISGEPLFSSLDKFDGHTGRPSFTKPIAQGHVVEKPDLSQGTERTEVRAHQSDSHLGHLFRDGPPPDGLRYTVNSGALRFVPQKNLDDQGYGEYLSLFANSPGESPKPESK